MLRNIKRSSSDGGIFQVAVGAGFIAFLISQNFDTTRNQGLIIFVGTVALVVLLGVIGLLVMPNDRGALLGTKPTNFIEVTCPNCGTHVTAPIPSSGRSQGEVRG